MPANFTESQLEEATLEWFQELGYATAFGPELSPGGDYPEREDYGEVLLGERLRDALRRLNPTLPPDALDEAYRKVAVPQSPSLLQNNRAFHAMLVNGVDVSYRQPDGTMRYTQAPLV